MTEWKGERERERERERECMWLSMSLRERERVFVLGQRAVEAAPQDRECLGLLASCTETTLPERLPRQKL